MQHHPSSGQHRQDGDPDDDVPFGTLFPARAPSEPWYPTARTAALIHVTLSLLADDIDDDVVTFGDAPVTDAPTLHSALHKFPEATWTADSAWRLSVAAVADELASALERGELPAPKSTAAWHILRVALNDAETDLAEDPDRIAAESMHLPADPLDYAWDDCRTNLLSGKPVPDEHDLTTWFDADSPPRH